MPQLTRESRALLSLGLTLAFLVGGLTDLGFTLYTALVSVLGNFVPGRDGFGVAIAAIVLAVSVGIHLLGRSAAKDGPQDDAWHHVGVAASWASLLLVVMGALALLGSLGANWPIGQGF